MLAVVTALSAVGSDRVDGPPSPGEREPESRSAQPSGSPSADRTAPAESSVPAAGGHDVGRLRGRQL